MTVTTSSVGSRTPLRSLPTACLLGLLSVLGAVTLPDGRAQTKPNDDPTQFLGYDQSSPVGPHHRYHEDTVSLSSPDGTITLTTNRFVQLETGLNYWEPATSSWLATEERFELLAGGAVAAARKGPHKVMLTANAAELPAVDLEGPDGTRLASTVYGLSLFDSSTGAAYFLGLLRDSIGVQVAPNIIEYPDAFDGQIQATLRYTYTKAGLEQDVILTSQPGISLEQLGFNPATTRLEVLTEFIHAPSPQRRAHVFSTGLEEDGTPRFDSTGADEFLTFGAMSIGSGVAFSLADSPEPGPGRLSEHEQVRVRKTWQRMSEGPGSPSRDFLIEWVPLDEVKAEWEQLPVWDGKRASVKRGVHKSRAVVGKALPKTGRAVARKGRVIKPAARSLAAAAPTGLVLDYYLTLTDTTNFTFKGDTTYYVSGYVVLSGTTTIEAGAVVKFLPFNPSSPVYSRVLVNGPLTCATEQYLPAIFTARDDDSVGSIISGSSGTVSGYYGWRMLQIVGGMSGATTLSNLKFLNGYEPLILDDGGTHELRHAQFNGCYSGVYPRYSGTTLLARNLLFHNTLYPFSGSSGSTVRAENITAHKAAYLNPSSSGALNLYLTNSAFISVTNMGEVLSTVFNYTNASSSGVLQTVGGGANYQSVTSPTFEQGTTNIHSGLLADLRLRTVLPPSVLTGGVTSPTTLDLVAQRGGNTPSIGYHYDPLDWLVSGLKVTNATVLVTNGAAVGVYGTNGIVLYGGASLVSEGTADRLNRIVSYNVVQEDLQYSATQPGHSIVFPASVSPAPSLKLNFTELVRFHKADSPGATHFDARDGGATTIELRNSIVKRAAIYPYNSSGVTFHSANNLLEKVRQYVRASTATLYNNTCIGGILNFYPVSGYSFTVKDNLFDGTEIWNQDPAIGTWATGFNANVTNSTAYWQMNPAGTGNVVLTNSPSFQTGSLGKYYFATNAAMVDAGSRTSAAAGLYHFTTGTNQVAETTTTVNIGFHYVATTSGLPTDTDADGVPDYLEDRNGNGTVDSGETDWNSSSDFGLRVLITQPRKNPNP